MGNSQSVHVAIDQFCYMLSVALLLVQTYQDTWIPGEKGMQQDTSITMSAEFALKLSKGSPG